MCSCHHERDVFHADVGIGVTWFQLFPSIWMSPITLSTITGVSK